MNVEIMEYSVVTNLEEQYSIWPTYKDIPEGWKSVGVTGSKDRCLDYIEENWTDMRPASLRDQLDGCSVCKAPSGDA